MNLIKRLSSISQTMDKNGMVREAEIIDNIMNDVSESYGSLIKKLRKMEYDLQDYHEYLQKMRNVSFTEPDDDFFERYSDLIDKHNELLEHIRRYEIKDLDSESDIPKEK